ncbi:WecB/TagA/CpsF family glycosyltransferase [Spirosoma agri]|uniref:WecB/TagA/CpsF family glycosyltransferase n=2 Tax=Spirosoma agri TaxID=1987381 RepID=A0A6M0ISB6_9BACT|nr:WecB/TagA/CpsF family glycosyltransferase [Spirosoma agri]
MTANQDERLHKSASVLLRESVISLNLTLQTYDAFIQDVLRVARLRKSAYCCFANVHMLVEARHDRTFAQQVNKATWITPDGVPLRWALRAFYGIKQERITGLDVLPTLLAEAARQQLPVYFYGSSSDVLTRCAAFCANHHPTLRIVGHYAPPFRPLHPDEEQRVVDEITASGAALVFVSLGCPKQEKWMAAMSAQIPAVLLGIGGALPVLIGDFRRAPHWMQQWGLEWLFRLGQEPHRLVKRYVVTNLWFIYYFLRQLARQPGRS